MKFRSLFLTAVLVGGVAAVPAPTAQLADEHEQEGMGSDNIRHVVNIPHPDPDRDGAPGGSDIEFFEISYDVDEWARRGLGPPSKSDLDGDLSNGVDRRYAVAGTTGNGMHIYDISDPENTEHITVYDCPANQGDSQIFTRTEDDGTVRTFTTYTVEDGGSAVPGDVTCAEDVGLEPGGGTEGSEYTGTFIIELTDPYAPEAVGFIEVPEGSHNGTVHPSGDYFYNSNSSLYVDTARDGGPGIEYYDIRDVTAPERLGRLALPPVPASLGTESHDITFNADGTRAYSAALSQGVIIDTSDPADPTILSNWVDPSINVWHQSDPITIGDGDDARTLLVVEDEVAGAVPTGQCPNGGVHVFDVTGDPAVPQKLGYWNIDEVRVTAADGSPALSTCTAHVLRLHPDEMIMTIAYYNGGVRVVDLAGLAGIGLGENAVAGDDPMTQLAYHRFEDSNSWAVKTPGIAEDGSFYLFSNDRTRGLDVYHYDGTADAEAAAQGRWMTPAQAEVELTRFTPEQLRANPGYVCFLG